MYTIEINFKSHKEFHSGLSSLWASKQIAEKYSHIPGAGVIKVVNDATGKIEYTIDQ